MKIIVRRRLWPLAGIGALLVALLGGCGPIAATIDTQNALRDAGYQSVSVNFSVGNTDEVKVSVTVNAGATLSQADDVAHIVWNKFHERFSLLAVTVHGTSPAVTRDYSYSDLVTLFGPRNPAYDRTSLSSATTRLGVIVVVVLVVLIAVVVVVIVMVTRRRRRRPPTWPPGGPPWMQGGPPSGPGPWQPGGPPHWQGAPQSPVPPGPHPPASYPMWPPPQGPPPVGQGGPGPGQAPEPESPPHGQVPGGAGTRPDEAPAWPPAPPPPSSDD
ncbi:MAG TPA: hypothetical protein VFZ97_08130 [Acidimicrobiales bacterium]